MAFEVIDPLRDPHIISYEKSNVILLDIIHRASKFQPLPEEGLKKAASIFGLQCKEYTMKFSDWNSFSRWLQEASKPDWQLKGEFVEGFVIVDQSGFLFKLKLEYYSFWKRMRSLKDRVLRIRQTQKPLQRDISDPRAQAFYQWCCQQSDECLRQDIGTLRQAFSTGEQMPRTPTPPQPSKSLVGFQAALRNLSKEDTIRQATADALLLRVLADNDLLQLLQSHPLRNALLLAASPGDNQSDAALLLGVDIADDRLQNHSLSGQTKD